MVKAVPGTTEHNIPIERPAADSEVLDRDLDEHLLTKPHSGTVKYTALDICLVSLGKSCSQSWPRASVKSTARSAHGCEIVSLDALTDTSIEGHDNNAAQIFPRLGEAVAADDVTTNLRTRP